MGAFPVNLSVLFWPGSNDGIVRTRSIYSARQRVARLLGPGLEPGRHRLLGRSEVRAGRDWRHDATTGGAMRAMIQEQVPQFMRHTGSALGHAGILDVQGIPCPQTSAGGRAIRGDADRP